MPSEPARIVISEFMDERAVAQLRVRHDVVYDPTLVDDPPRLIDLASEAQVLIVRNRTEVRGTLLGKMLKCKVIGRLGANLENIDTEVCEALGIRVIAATGANAQSVAEYVLTASMMLMRGIFHANADMIDGQWPRQSLSHGHEIAGKTMGLIGFGSIGQRVARLAQALDMIVIAFDPSMDKTHPAFNGSSVRPVTLERLLTLADVISVHVPLGDATRGMINSSRIATMKRSAVLVNTARGGIVDEGAMATALREGRLGGAALDVFAQEPLPASPAFGRCPNLLLTPHVAGVTMESNERVSLLVAERVLEALA